MITVYATKEDYSKYGTSLLENNETTNDVEYKLFISSIIEKFK